MNERQTRGCLFARLENEAREGRSNDMALLSFPLYPCTPPYCCFLFFFQYPDSFTHDMTIDVNAKRLL